MKPTSIEVEFFNWIASGNYYLMQVADKYTLVTFTLFTLVGSAFGMSPLKSHPDHNFAESILVKVRQGILIGTAAILCSVFVMGIVYGQTVANSQQGYNDFARWFFNSIISRWYLIPMAGITGLLSQFIFKRYLLTTYSGILRKLRNTQTKDKQSDIRNDSGNTQTKNFTPSKQYKKGKVFFGLGEDDKPLYIPEDTWYETNMQVIGPTRYGKGVQIGGLMDQSIKRGDCIFYIDPKEDKFAPHIMYQAARKTGKKFYYIDLNNPEISKWAPFAGGTATDAFSRFETAFGLELTGDPGTDFYKTQELKEARSAFDKTNSIEGLKSLIENTEAAKLDAELDKWSRYPSLSPKKGKGFSIGKALEESAVVYVRGNLDDSTIKTATKAFIAEMVQEARRLEPKRESHATFFVDEVSFLVSRILTQALATIVGFRVNMVLAYQSQNDLLSVDDSSLDPKYVYNSVNVNCQIKVVHGGADFETADNISKLSGTIIKEVTQREQTDISSTGGETWAKQRTVAPTEEALITANRILTLPPRVSVLIRPTELATICYSSFVPVKNRNDLKEYVEKKKTPQNNPERNEQAKAELKGIDTPVSQAKPATTKQNKPQVSRAKQDESKAPKNNAEKPQAKQAEQRREGNALPRWKKPTQPKDKNDDKKVSPAKPVTDKEDEKEQKIPKDKVSPAKQAIDDDNPFIQENDTRTNNPPSDPMEKEREKRRKRKQQQAEKRKKYKSEDQEPQANEAVIGLPDELEKEKERERRRKRKQQQSEKKKAAKPESTPDLKGSIRDTLSQTKSDEELLSALEDTEE